LPRVILSSVPFQEDKLKKLRKEASQKLKVSADELTYYFQTGEVENHAYNLNVGGINMITKSGKLKDLAEASDNHTLLAQTETVKKYVLYLPK
jgi:hypothetical protein